ncbi:MAG: hypothetical protein KF861_14670 [Planctomycetaceae bacterium]|nr:hypothetical protein [Planctomycetaceae bacterium]
MSSLKWLKHAFAVDAAAPRGPTAEQSAVIDRLCREIVRRRLTTPAVIYLEMSRPLGFVAAQALHFFTPLISALTDSEGHRHFAEFLESRHAIDFLLDRLHAIERDESLPSRRETEEARRESDHTP